MTEAKAQKGYRVSGRVQGVGYRWWTYEKGTELGLRGTVKNLPDGTVEVHAAGSTVQLEELKRLLGKGPWSATVHSVEEIPSLESIPTTFEVRF
jgi:acylphosphatase